MLKKNIDKKHDFASVTDIENMIFNVRGVQVMIDRDLAQLYGVSTSRLNEQVKRNIARFPESFRFQLTEQERDEVIAICDNLWSLKFNPTLPYVFTEQGIAQLSSVLHSMDMHESAYNDTSVKIMNAFVAMRRFLISNAAVFQRLESLEHNQFEFNRRLDDVFKRIDVSLPPKQGIFYDGQIFDAYTFVCDLIRSARQRIVLFDNYVDDSVLTMLDKRENGVSVRILTKNISQQLQLDIDRHNAQYPPLSAEVFPHAHDRFLCIDETIYHIGASLKDLGKKWFAFSRMEETTTQLLARL